MGFKADDNVMVQDDDGTSWLGRIVRYVGDGNFEVEDARGGDPTPRIVSARALRHLDSAHMRVARKVT